MPSAFATPTFGLGVELMDDQGRVLSGSVQGEVALVPPSMGLSLKLLNKPQFDISVHIEVNLFCPIIDIGSITQLAKQAIK